MKVIFRIRPFILDITFIVIKKISTKILVAFSCLFQIEMASVSISFSDFKKYNGQSEGREISRKFVQRRWKQESRIYENTNTYNFDKAACNLEHNSQVCGVSKT